MLVKNYHIKRLSSFLLALCIMTGIVSSLAITAEASENTNVILDIPWAQINKCGNQYEPSGNSKACQAYSFAYCKIILEKKSHVWTEYRAKGSPYMAVIFDAIGYSNEHSLSRQVVLKAVYDNVNNGRPVILNVISKNTSGHYVVAVGYKSGCDPAALKESDIIIINPSNKNITASAGSKENYTFLGPDYSLKCNTYNKNLYQYGIAKSGGVGVLNISKTNTDFEPSILSVIPTAYPTGTLSQGSRYSLKGTIKSNYNITSIRGEIISDNGDAVFSYTQKPNSKSFSILNSKLDANLKFNELSPGTYYLKYTAEDASGKQESWTSGAFKVVGKNADSTLKITPSAYPTGTLSQGSRYSLKGTVKSNYNITSVKGEIISDSGEVAFSYKQSPNSKSFSILNSKLDANMKFNELTPGTYYLRYTAEDECGKQETWTSGKFAVQGNVSERTYTITFDANGGNVNQGSKTVVAGKGIGALPAPVREGYDFIGWTMKNGMNVTSTTVISQDITVYALWQPQPVEEPDNEGPDSNTAPEEPKGYWDDWSDWSSTSVSASDTRQVEIREIKVSDAYMEYRYGNYMNGSHDCWCPEYGATLPYKGTWVETFTPWSRTPKKDTGHNAFCADERHRHDHMDGRDSNGWANWSIYSDDGVFYNGRVYWYWEETRTIPAVYETQYRYRDWISG